jgi:formiminotetrahydrofolate cyclodeaminase
VSLLSQKTTFLLEHIASPDPTPGGGSASALAGAIGGALVAMVCAMSKTRSGEEGERQRLDRALGVAREARGRLQELVDLDQKAFDAVMGAYRLPKATDEEKRARKEAIGKAMKEATDVPLETAGECLRVLKAALEAAEAGNPNALSDARTGAALALAGLLGAFENVRINAPEGEAFVRARGMVEEALKTARGAGLAL